MHNKLSLDIHEMHNATVAESVCEMRNKFPQRIYRHRWYHESCNSNNVHWSQIDTETERLDTTNDNQLFMIIPSNRYKSTQFGFKPTINGVGTSSGHSSTKP